jgi:hypothetical protein
MLLRRRLARLIVIYSGLLVVLPIVLFLLTGFDMEEFTTLTGLLAPIFTIYLGTLSQYLGDMAENAPEQAASRTSPKLLKSIAPLIVHIHFAIVFLLVMAAAFNLVEFEAFKLIFIFVETSYGGFVGYIIAAIFKTKKEE